MKRFNAALLGEKLVRKLAGHTSRRGLLSKLGLALAAAPVFPVLPISRANAQGGKPDRVVPVLPIDRLFARHHVLRRDQQELRAAGLITLRDRSLTILDPQALRNVAMFNPNYLHQDRR